LDLQALARLPDGTLGREFVRYFERNGIQPFVTSFPIESDVDYLSKRYRETHDLFHVITGYGTDELGEMELQAFVLGNLGLWQTVMILAVSVPRQLQELGARRAPEYAGRLRAAYRRGKRSREMLSVSYEKLWAEPVSRLAELLCAAV
ncbi:MAG TPA: Coq4 family protein, partial [Nannocystaceae bacterium]|nr:Coq4 family protein [Nannocystaceae bacterium]